MKTSQLCQVIFVSIMLMCATRPMWWPANQANNQTKATLEENWAFDAWNTSHQTLYKLPLSEVEQSFAANFPGHIARFTNGDTVWVVRHTVKPTRMLHSSVDCYRGLGYNVSMQRVVENARHQRWRCFEATKGQRLEVCERILDKQGKQWTDVSAWYWENIFNQQQHAWWAITQVNRIENKT